MEHNNFQGANAAFIDALAKQFAEGMLNAEDASKLLNTLARFEERVRTTEQDHL